MFYRMIDASWIRTHQCGARARPAFVCPSTTSDCVLGGDAFTFSGELAARTDVEELQVSLQLDESAGVARLVDSLGVSQ